MSGIGNINNAGGVGYTDMTGLGLDAATQNEVKVDAAVSSSMATDIQNALAQFRAEGNFNPTSAEMEAKLSAVSVAANAVSGVAQQDDINQAQDLLSGLQQVYQAALTDANGNANTATGTFCSLAEAGGPTTPAGGTALAGMTITGVFGSSVANYQGPNGNMVEGLLATLIPSAFNANANPPLPAGYWGTGQMSPAAIQTLISTLQTQIDSMKSAASSTFTDTTGAASMASDTSMTAAQWLTKEMGVQSPSDSYSIEQWSNIAQKLQTNAAQQLSELSIGNGGGIQELNGQYFVNGQELSLSQINFCVRANQYQLIDQQVADQMNAVQANNAQAQQAQQVLAAIETYDGENINTDQSATCNVSSLFGGDNGGAWGAVQHYLNTNFGVTATSVPNYADYENVIANGTNPDDNGKYVQTGNTLSLATLATMGQNVSQFFSTLKLVDQTFYTDHFTDTNGGPPYTMTGTMTNSDYQDVKTSFATYLQNNSSDSQVSQQRLDALNNSRQSILDGMSSFTQGQAQSTGQIGTNL